MLCAMLEAKVLCSSKFKFVPNDCSYVSNKLNEKCCDFSEVTDSDESSLKNKLKSREQISLGVTLLHLASKGNLRARLLARCPMGTQHVLTHFSNWLNLSSAANQWKVKENQEKFQICQMKKIIWFGVLWTTKQFVWRWFFFVLLFSFVICSSVEVEWLCLCFLLPTSVSVYY